MSEPVLVRELMTVGVKTCSPDTPIVDIARLMLQEGIEALVVLDHQGHAVGIVGQDDLVRAYSRENHHDLTAEEVMRADVPQIPPDIPLTAAAQIMQDQGVRVLFLMHHAGGIEYPAAMISYRHFLRHLIAQDSDDLHDLGIHAARQSPLEAFIQKRDAARRQAKSGSSLKEGNHEPEHR
jgi:CBS-domain-containing membrane protein